MLNLVLKRRKEKLWTISVVNLAALERYLGSDMHTSSFAYDTWKIHFATAVIVTSCTLKGQAVTWTEPIQ
ncbi:hypothetical protein EMCRGX_G029001 [Ephydatia muelleri]